MYPKMQFYQQKHLPLQWKLSPFKHPVYSDNKGISENS